MNLRIALIVTVTAAALYFIFSGGKSGTPAGDALQAKGRPQLPGGAASEIEMQWIESSNPADWPTAAEIIEQAKTGRLRPVSVLWQLRRDCRRQAAARFDKGPEGSKQLMDHCNRVIMQAVKERYGNEEDGRVVRLLDKYLGYEEAVRSTKDWPKDSKERMQSIRQLRRTHMGSEDAELVFGYDERRLDYSALKAEKFTELAEMPAARRREEFTSWKNQFLGDYREAFLERQGKYGLYTETEDLLADQVKSAENRSAYLFSLRSEILGEEAAARMAEVEKTLAAENELYTKLAEKEASIKALGLSEDETQKRIEELRLELLGEEGAKQYALRLKYLETSGK